MVLLSVIQTRVKIYRNTSRNIHNGFVIDPTRKNTKCTNIGHFCEESEERVVKYGTYEQSGAVIFSGQNKETHLCVGWNS